MSRYTFITCSILSKNLLKVFLKSFSKNVLGNLDIAGANYIRFVSKFRQNFVPSCQMSSSTTCDRRWIYSDRSVMSHLMLADLLKINRPTLLFMETNFNENFV
jgi:hypothetical protein